MKLLIQACSARKFDFQNLPALQIYDGVAFRVIKKALHENKSLEPSLDILILSAEYGLISSDTIISTYERRIDKKRAESLKMQNLMFWEEFSAGNNYEEIFINIGKDYLRALALIDFPENTTFGNGGIGYRNQQLKNFLTKGEK